MYEARISRPMVKVPGEKQRPSAQTLRTRFKSLQAEMVAIYNRTTRNPWSLLTGCCLRVSPAAGRPKDRNSC